jgi:hypothetical protein
MNNPARLISETYPLHRLKRIPALQTIGQGGKGDLRFVTHDEIESECLSQTFFGTNGHMGAEDGGMYPSIDFLDLSGQSEIVPDGRRPRSPTYQIEDTPGDLVQDGFTGNVLGGTVNDFNRMIVFLQYGPCRGKGDGRPLGRPHPSLLCASSFPYKGPITASRRIKKQNIHTYKQFLIFSS